MKNTEAIILIENTYNLINQTKKISDKNELLEFVGKEGNPNFNKLVEFYSDFYSISFSYLYRYAEDKEQSEFSSKFQEICKWIISHEEIFKNSENYDYIPDALLDKIENIEKNHISNLINNKEVENFYSEIEHHIFRLELEEIIKNGKYYLSKSKSSFLNEHDNYFNFFLSQTIKTKDINNIEISENTYADINVIFGMMPASMLEKINKKFVEFVRSKADSTNGLSNINPYTPLKDQKLAEETENILALIYDSYFNDIKEIDSELKKRDITQDKQIKQIKNFEISDENTNGNKKTNENMQIIKYKENLIIKMIKKIKFLLNNKIKN